MVLLNLPCMGNRGERKGVHLRLSEAGKVGSRLAGKTGDYAACVLLGSS